MVGKKKANPAEDGRWCWLEETPFRTLEKAAGKAFRCRSCARISDVEKGLTDKIWIPEEAVGSEKPCHVLNIALARRRQ